MIKKLLILLSLIFAAGCSSNAAGEKTAEGLEIIKIGYPSSGGNWQGGTLAVADHYGYLNAELEPLGYKAEVVGYLGAAPEIQESILAGDLQYTTYAAMAAVLGKANGMNTTLINIDGKRPAWELAASKNSGIEKAGDLRGKTIAYQRGTAVQEYIFKILEDAGISSEEVELVNMNVPEGISALITNAVDACVVSMGQDEAIIKEGGKIIHSSAEEDKNRYWDLTALVGESDFVKKYPEVTEAIIRAEFKARDKILDNPEKFYELYEKESGFSKYYVDKAVRTENLEERYPLDIIEQDIDKMKEIEEFLIKSDFIQRPVDYGEFINKEYLNNAANDLKEWVKE